MGKLLEVKNLSKKYRERIVVNNISFDGYKGEVLGFLGPNGAGKTTTIRMITGLINSNGGTVNICGSSINEDFECAMKNIGAIVETPTLYEFMTGEDNIKLFAKLKKASSEQVERVKKITGLGEDLKRKVKEYSLGMKQRVAIGIAVLGDSKILILDEPSNGLDPIGIKELRVLLKELAHNEGKCILVSSHQLQEMQLTCDRAIIISKGNILKVVDVNKLNEEKKSLEDLFLELTKGDK